MGGIDTKAFLEFCKKEYDMEFVDGITGKKVLDIIAENEKTKKAIQICEHCRWCAVGEGKTMLKGDRVCVNGDSEFVTEFVSKDNACEQWEAKDTD